MALHALTNDRWGFASKCFVCEPTNLGGLQIPFFHDDERHVVVATFTLDETFSGAPTLVHGGVALAVLDEAMAWATIAIAERFAVTRTTTTTFDRPVRVGREHRVEASIVRRDGDDLHTLAVIVDAKGRVCARATAEFHALNFEQASTVAGATLNADEARLTEPQSGS